MKNLKEKINSSIKKEILKLKENILNFQKISKTYSIIRLIVFLSGMVLFLSFYIYDYKTTAWIILFLFSVVFIVLIIKHNKVESSIKKFNIYLQIKNENVARSNLDWKKIPPINSKVLYNITPLEQDLNIVEQNGLLQLINTGISNASIDILREWMSGRKSIKEKVVENQKIIQELKSRNHFRERLLLTSKLSTNEKIQEIKILDWIKDKKTKRGLRNYTIFLSFLCFISIFFSLGYITGFISIFYYQPLLVYLFFYYVGFKFIDDIKKISEILYDEVRKFYSIFNFIEKYNYGNNVNLKKALSPILESTTSPTKALNSINFAVETMNLRVNPFLWFAIICIVPIDYLLAIKVEKFKKLIKTDFPKWLDAWYKLEAYCSLATFAHLNPSYNFAEIDEEQDLLFAQKVGHPLIKYESSVTNDYGINSDNRISLITGSNMSGKSTFLRTIGINTLLAYTGSVVNAEKFVLSKFNLYTCIKVSDSVVDGISYFYAEVKRLKNIIESIKQSGEKSLVLIDEIYKGTNNIERIVGSKALIKYLYSQNIYSLISTHDLEMVTIENEIENVKNYHFKENFNDNKMSFDYKLMDGPCPTTNALKIMQIEGLPT